MDYSSLNQIPDAGTRRAVKHLLDRLGQLEKSHAASAGTVTRPLAQTLNANGQPIANLPDPVSPNDAVHLKAMQNYVAQASPADRMVNPDLTTPSNVQNGHVWVEQDHGTGGAGKLRLYIRHNNKNRVLAEVAI